MAKKAKKGSTFDNFSNKLLNLDRFSSPIQLNINGRTTISSWPGVFTTLILILILVFYALQKGQIMLYKENPDIYVATFENFFEPSYEFKLEENGFKIAFGVNDYRTGQPYDDPNFVTWTVRLNEYVNQRSVSKKNVAFHKCTEQDYDSFYPPSENDVQSIKSIRE